MRRAQAARLSFFSAKTVGLWHPALLVVFELQMVEGRIPLRAENDWVGEQETWGTSFCPNSNILYVTASLLENINIRTRQPSVGWMALSQNKRSTVGRPFQ